VGETTETSAAGSNVAWDLVARAEELPEAPALHYSDGDCAWSYRRLAAEAAAVTAWLAATDVRPGDRVALFVGSWPEHVAAWYGALAAGAIVVDVNYILGNDDWRRLLQDSSPAAVVAASAFRERLEELGVTRSLPVLWAEECGIGWPQIPPDELDPVRVDADDVALVAYTSGTTGEPKGVMHTHGGIRRQLELLGEAQPYRAGDVVYQAVPLFALPGYLPQVASTLRAGGSVFLADRFDAAGLAAASRRFPFTYITLAAPMLDAILRLPERDRPEFRALRTMTAGGAPLQPEVRARFEELVGVPLSQGYGMTEMIGVMVVDYEGDAPWGSCGRIRPLDSKAIVVLDDDGATLPPDEVGEFAVHRDCTMVGYWGKPELFAAQFSGDWFRTGDIGKIDDAGFFYLLDRKKDMIIRGGFNIYSAEIERVLTEHPGVAEATVVGAPDERLGEVPVAFIVLTDGATESPRLADELLAECRDRLGSLKTPAWVRVVDADDLPRNALRKVKKRELRDSLQPVR
jgi:long-chain acyl-CoA synthetase